jgi:hypothetical protein
VVRRRVTSQGIKDLGNRGIRLFAESFGSEATRIRVVTAKSECMYSLLLIYILLAHTTTALLASKIPLYVEAPPGPGSLDVIRRAFANGRKDFLTPEDKEYKTISDPRTVPEVIEILSSPQSDTSVAPRRTRSKVKKEESPDAPLLQASKKRGPKKSKEIITDSDEISDEDDDAKHTQEKGKSKATATAQTTMKDIKGKGKAVSAKKHEQDKVILIDVNAEPATQAIPPNNSSQRPAPTPIATEANLGPPTATSKLVFKPISELIAATQAVAAAARARGVATESAVTTTAKPTPRPIKKPTVPIWDSGDAFLIKPSVSTNEGHLQGPAQPGQAPKARTPHHTQATVAPNVNDSTTTATHKKPSAFGPPRNPSAAPPSLPNSSKRVVDGENVTNAAAPKRLRSAPESPSPEGDVGAQALQESSSRQRMTAEDPAASSAQPAAATSAQGYQWPYGSYYSPFGFPPAPPGWPYPSWNQDRPAGSAGDSVPAFPFPPHPMMPFPPFYHSGAGAAANAPNVPEKPAEGEPGPSRST